MSNDLCQLCETLEALADEKLGREDLKLLVSSHEFPRGPLQPPPLIGCDALFDLAKDLLRRGVLLPLDEAEV